MLGTVVPGGDPYFMLRSNLESADVVLVGRVDSVKEEQAVMLPTSVVASLKIDDAWQGVEIKTNVPKSVRVLDWWGPGAEPRRKGPWMFFLERVEVGSGRLIQGLPHNAGFRLQSAIDLANMSPSRLGTLRSRVRLFQAIGKLESEIERTDATIQWLMLQVRDPDAREGATYELERPELSEKLSNELILELQDLYCSLPTYDSTAGHLTDILEKVAVDRARFVQCTFNLLQSEVERASWIEEGLVSVLEDCTRDIEFANLVEEYRDTKPVASMRGFQDSAEMRVVRSDVLRRLCSVAQRVFDDALRRSPGQGVRRKSGTPSAVETVVPSPAATGDLGRLGQKVETPNPKPSGGSVEGMD